MKKISGNIVDIVNKRIYQGTLHIADEKIVGIIEEKTDKKHFILPGLIDAHIHIESSMLPPSEFARLAVVHGTVASVSDPHEIANVLGLDGIRFMIENGKKVPFKFYFGASSCVPATSFETSGASLGAEDIDELLQSDDIKYLSEMMNYPGVLNKDSLVMAKIELARKYQKPVDGHAPGLKGEDARQYIEAGISTDHECFALEEALEKIKYGMKIQIREGSAAKNFDALIPLIGSHPQKVMFCSDDRHPNDLVNEHINSHVKRALEKGYDLFDVLRAATLNPIEHYNLDVGLLRQGDDADFIIVDDIRKFNVLKTYISGILVSDKSKSKISRVSFIPENNFSNIGIDASDLQVKPTGKHIKVIDALDGQLITKQGSAMIKSRNGNVISNPDNDILKLVVLNRYAKATPAIGFVRGFGLKHGAIASTVAHDSHNIIATGASDELIAEAINLLVDSGGGISACDDRGDSIILPLPVAGLMSEEDGYQVAEKYEQIDLRAKDLGSKLQSPFMTLSFMALLVIPELKLSDKGLFDGSKFVFTPLFTS
jgi:adenine deaminase